MNTTGSQPKKAPQTDAGHMPISEEMDRARWTLPPMLPVIGAALIVAVVLAIYTYHASRPLALGKILGVFAVEQPSKSSVLVGIQFSLQNVSKAPVTVRSSKVQITPGAGSSDNKPLEDEAASAVDFERYFQAYPELGLHRMEPLRPETKLLPGEKTEGMVIVAFPIAKDAFDKRQSLRVVVDLYDHLPVMIQQ